MDNILEVTGLVKRYPSFTLDNISFSFVRMLWMMAGDREQAPPCDPRRHERVCRHPAGGLP